MIESGPGFEYLTGLHHVKDRLNDQHFLTGLLHNSSTLQIMKGLNLVQLLPTHTTMSLW